MKRPLLFLSVLSVCSIVHAAPNILLILADDFGYADTGVQGSKDIPTPHLDSIAKNGVRFTSGYVTCHMCSPSRAGLLTGRYQQRFGHEFNPGEPREEIKDWGLPLDEKTFADRMKAAGYATGIVGKWHLGSNAAHHPMSRGFDEFFGFLDGGHPYDLDAKRGKEQQKILRDREIEAQTGFLTTRFGDEAAAFIGRHRALPWFLYLAFNATHSPMQVTPAALERVKHIADERRRAYAAMTVLMDDAVGAVLAKLEGTDTLICFLCDNGGPKNLPPTNNAPLRGNKYDITEGGIRVPFFMQWKGHLPAGTTFDQPVISLDLLPTALAAAGVSADAKLDGINLLPHLAKQKPLPERPLFWRIGKTMAVRVGDWKLLKEGKRAGDAPQLFNLAADVGESADLAAANADKTKRLMAVWEKWNGTLPEPVAKRRSEKK